MPGILCCAALFLALPMLASSEDIGYQRSDEKFRSDVRNAEERILEKLRHLRVDLGAGFLLRDNLGLMALLNGDIKAAVTDFEGVVKDRPDYADGYEHLALAEIQAQNYEGAIRNYTKAIELSPETVFYAGERGGAYLALGRPEEAVKDFDRVLKKNPKSARVLRHKSMALASLGKYAEAAEAYQHAVSLNPELRGKDPILCKDLLEHRVGAAVCGG